jgi:peptidoglycan/LPS O-acetylase OafA/YrhL
MSDVSTRNSNRSRLVLGIFLIVLGAVLLAANLGFELPYGWWRFYPFIFIVFGALGLFMPSRHLDRSGGVWLLAIGVYCAIGVYDLFDLGWTGGWPVFVIAAGASFMLHRHRVEADGGPGPPMEP